MDAEGEGTVTAEERKAIEWLLEHVSPRTCWRPTGHGPDCLELQVASTDDPAVPCPACKFNAQLATVAGLLTPKCPRCQGERAVPVTIVFEDPELPQVRAYYACPECRGSGRAAMPDGRKRL